MKLTAWLSVLTSVAAIRVPNAWERRSVDRRALYPQGDGWIPIIPNPPEKRNVPQVIFNPFKQKKPIYTSQNFPYKTIPLRQTQHNHQTAASIDSFLRNFNVDQFINSQPPVPVPQLANIQKQDPFSNFNVNAVLQARIPQVHPTHSQPTFQFVPKNYRDDKTHEPLPFDPERDREDVPVPERNEEEESPVSEHEDLPETPTRPIYPGEGKWAKKGIKHRPFISQHKYATLEDPPVKPDGYQTFVAADNSFDDKREKFREDLNSLPINHKLGEFLPETPSQHQNLQESEEEESDEDFVPTRLYAQVRNSEDVEHLPAESDENGRLKEVIKDSKVQTVYTEEGYEDSAYDHEGHEKKAQNEEGFEEFDRELETEEEKKKPKKKHNLHKPKYHTVEYTSGDGLFTDEEIERDKQEKLSLPEDSDAEPSQHDYRSNDNVLDKPRKNKKNDFMSTKEVKITTAKENGDGDTDMEINGEVRVISQPNNSSKSTQFYKKYPTVHKMIAQKKEQAEDQEEIATVEQLKKNITTTTGIYIEEVFNYTTTTSPLATTQEPFIGDSNLEIPVTTLATTAIPKTHSPTKDPIANPLLSIDKAFSQIPTRNKRSQPEFLPKIEIDTDFISKINHTLGEPKKDTTDEKYPYYKSYKTMGLNEDSPLRYAEDMRNIPRKLPGRMTFYEQAESKMPCPEIASTVEPIPERILNKDEDEDEEDEDGIEGSESVNEEVQEPVLPRLNGLGDKIDCLKTRYFGENPLDSPFFKEETVGEVKPAFNFDSNAANSANVENIVEATEYEEENSLDGKAEEVDEDVANVDTINITTTTVRSLITTPNYTIELKPNNIYDQIQLLNYLPGRKNETNSTIEEPIVAKDNSTAKPSVRIETTINVRAGKKLDVVTELLPEAEKLNRPRRIHIRRNRPLYQIFDVNKYLPTTIPPHPHHLTTTPKQQVVRMYQYKRKGPLYQIFDVNKFLPSTTPIPLFQNIATTVLPKYKVISEVSYKDDIKPNEQLNVFTDVLNNIKTSSEEELKNELHDSKTEPSNVRSTTSKQEDSYMKAYEDQEVDSNYYSSIITTNKPAIAQETTLYKIPHLSQKANKEDEKHRLYVALKEAMKKHRLQTTSEIPHTTTPMDKSTEVMGLMPPKPKEYKTIHTAKRDNGVFLGAPAINTNKFYVIGMKPPPLQQRMQYYSDFIKNNKKPRLRVKRSPNKPTYAQLSRGRTDADEPKEEVDDYVPHRPKNYYYDEKLGKIVYTNNKNEEDAEDEAEEVIYEEITEAPATTSKPKQNPIFATATPPPSGESFVDFVNKLKSAAGYHEIPDPEPTEKDELKESTTTAKPVSTTPPEFLNILAKVRQDSTYKQIEDEDEKKKEKNAATTEAAEEIEEEEEEEEGSNIVKNSAGMQIHEIGNNFEIFDITDFIPKIKNYLPRTSVDTSKYQTIRRPQARTDSETETSETREVSTSAIVESVETATTKKEEATTKKEKATTTTTTTTTVASTTKSARKLVPPRGRFRRPTTTVASLSTTPTTTSSPPTTTTVASSTSENNPRKNFRRGRIRPTTTATTTTTTTTEKFIFDEEEDTTKVLKRRSDSEIHQQDEPQNGLKEQAPSVASVVEVFKKFDPRRRHGGNLRRANELERVEISTDNAKNEVRDAEVIATIDEKNKHGGNYRSEDDEDLTDNNNDSSVSVERTRSPRLLRRKPVSANRLETDTKDTKEGFNNKPKRVSRRPTRKPSVQRLTDVVPKPEAFYTDPGLASTINKMVEPLRISLDDVEGITDSSEESKDANKSSISPRRSVIQKRRGEPPERRVIDSSTKKPLFIKDPNKRLYFYAPI